MAGEAGAVTEQVAQGRLLTRQGVGWRIQKILGELRELLTGSGGFTDCSLEN